MPIATRPRQLSATAKNTLAMRLNDADRLIHDADRLIGDMSSSRQLRMQDIMSKQQQTMQALSNIMKKQNEVLKSIVQNLK